MEEKDAERLSKKLLTPFNKAKKKYKGKSPNLTFVIIPEQNQEYVGWINNDDGHFEGTYNKYGFWDKFFRSPEKLTLEIKFDKHAQEMIDLKEVLIDKH